MYAVIESGGKQFRVELGTEIEVDRLDGDPGSTVELGRVLLVADGDDATIGRPVVDGARVSASVVRQGRGEKITVFKYQPKARRRVKHGHRQETTVLRVSDIVFGDRSAAKQAEAERSEQERARADAEQTAARQAAADEALARRLAKQKEAESAATAPKSGRGTGPKGAGKSEAAPAKRATKQSAPEKGTTRRGTASAEGASSKASASGRKPTLKTGTTTKGGASTTRRRTQAPEPDEKPKRGTRKGS